MIARSWAADSNPQRFFGRSWGQDNDADAGPFCVKGICGAAAPSPVRFVAVTLAGAVLAAGILLTLKSSR